MSRTIQAFATPIVGLAIGAVVLWLGFRIVADPSGGAAGWLGWLLVIVGAAKLFLWSAFVLWLFRHFGSLR